MSIAKHYETGENIPDEIYKKLLAARTFRAGSQSLRQVCHLCQRHPCALVFSQDLFLVAFMLPLIIYPLVSSPSVLFPPVICNAIKVSLTLSGSYLFVNSS